MKFPGRETHRRRSRFRLPARSDSPPWRLLFRSAESHLALPSPKPPRLSRMPFSRRSRAASYGSGPPSGVMPSSHTWSSTGRKSRRCRISSAASMRRAGRSSGMVSAMASRRSLMSVAFAILKSLLVTSGGDFIRPRLRCQRPLCFRCGPSGPPRSGEFRVLLIAQLRTIARSFCCEHRFDKDRRGPEPGYAGYPPQ